MALEGKGIFVWKLGRIAGGQVARMVEKARSAGLTHVIIKIADGTSPYNSDLIGPAADALRAAGIQVWGWAWIWLQSPAEEARVAAQRLIALGMDGFVVNAEHPTKGKHSEARVYMDALRSRLPSLPIGLSSYRYPHYHTTLPWAELLTPCDLNLPQMYWIDEAPRRCVERTLARHQAFPFARPVVATGAAYGEQYGNYTFRSQPDQIVEFLDTVRAHHLPAANFWSWDWTEAHGPDLWQAIADYDWPLAARTEPDLAHQFWAALVGRNLEALASLYHENAVLVTAGSSVQGPGQIRLRFSALLDRLPNAQFHLDELRIEENVRFLRWNATSALNQVREGLDTIGVRAGKIQYHSSSYQLGPR